MSSCVCVNIHSSVICVCKHLFLLGENSAFDLVQDFFSAVSHLPCASFLVFKSIYIVIINVIQIIKLHYSASVIPISSMRFNLINVL